MTNIETFGNRIANAYGKRDDQIAKIESSTLTKISVEVIKAARHGITKVDLKTIRAAFVATYVGKGNSEDSANTQASQLMRLLKVAANLDKKLSEHWGIKTVDDGIAVLERIVAESTSLRNCYENLAIPKAADDGGDGDGDTGDGDTGEVMASDAQDPLTLLTGYISACKKHSVTPDEVFNLFQRVAADRDTFDKIWKAVATKHQ